MKTTDEMSAEWAKAIADAGVPTEAQMRDGKAPTPSTVEDLAEYVRGLVERPHDYGTCCYAMSYAAVAAFNFVASKLGVTGFQASCAELDILRQTRGFEWGRLLNFEDLLYPQCQHKFPGWEELLHENRERLAELAAKRIAESETPGALRAHPDVIAHWKMLVANGGKTS